VVEQFEDVILTDDAIALRIEMALAGLAPTPARIPPVRKVKPGGRL
jgi:hypothetical protein